jgi:poly-gamma-glutamate synthase PgsB/CapB
MKHSDIREIVEIDLLPVIARLHARLIDDVVRSVFKHIASKNGDKGLTGDLLRFAVLQYLMQWVRDQLQIIAALRDAYDEFVQQHGHSASAAERSRFILAFAETLGASPAQLRGDRRALKRWFGFEAVSERFHRRTAEAERDVAFVLQRIGIICSADLKTLETTREAKQRWRRINLEPLVKPLLAYRNSTAIRIAAFYSLATALRVLPVEIHEEAVNDETLRYIYRAALDRQQDIALQSEALKLLAEISPVSLRSALENRLKHTTQDDDIFVRRVALRLLGEHLAGSPELAESLERASEDPGPSVRQLLVPALTQAEPTLVKTILTRVALMDPVPQVRAAAVYGTLELLHRADLRPLLLAILADCLAGEADEFVLRVALKVAADGYHRLADSADNTAAEAWCDQLLPRVAELHKGAVAIGVRRYAAETHESIWVRSDAPAWHLVKELSPFLVSLKEGRQAVLPQRFSRQIDEPRFGRVLAWLARQDFSLDVELRRRPRISRGHRFGFRAWRFWHEMRQPSTDKRQALSHTVGRIFRGTLHAPSAILSELAMTKVPGEPLFVTSENGWRPYLPLVDELISALDQSMRAGPLKLYTCEGLTEVYPPAGLARRLLARIRLTTRFEYYAHLRNWDENSTRDPEAYLDALRTLGFDFRFSGHEALPGTAYGVDPAVTRFFPALFPLSIGEWSERLKDYFFSVYENSLSELILFLLAIGGWFVGRHLWMAHLIRRTRRDMPLVIGGWGTRGKSGTERLKAALFNALGYNVVSKTTGCEAMFLHGHAQGALREMFLFRPYDKATIWEQVQVLRLAQRLHGEVFLWECMGLTPAYVEILQQHWMRDDISTITNTYPDHEDLQGPAGINIPRVMTNFIPRQATLITTEEQMLPILREAAQQRNTRVKAVGWLEAGMLPPDLLERFPYEEHPYNIALVLAMAEGLGVDRDFAIREMADRVVADLGVLKVSPPANVRGRTLEFTNGMSANERFGCMANWKRMGYLDQDPYAEPGVYLTTVVNNRADRVPRSRVFASMLVNDLMADRHILIGTNLDGLRNYIAEAWKSFAETITLWPQSGEAVSVESWARRLRLPYRPDQVQRELATLLANLGLEDASEIAVQAIEQPSWLTDNCAGRIQDVDSLQRHLEQRLQTVNEYQALAERVARAGNAGNSSLDRELRDQLWKWFERKLLVIDDAHANGEQVIDQLVRATPPGACNRVMGVQNIKGTGLDFVYRWQAWENCHQACVMLNNDDEQVAQQGLRILSGFRDFGLLSFETVQAVLDSVKHGRFAQSERFQAELNVITSNLQLAMKRVRVHLEAQRSAGWLSTLANSVEAFLDAGDAISRRKQANLIYRELASQRISHAQAALELQALIKRQKGGWLLLRLESLWAQLKFSPGSRT